MNKQTKPSVVVAPQMITYPLFFHQMVPYRYNPLYGPLQAMNQYVYTMTLPSMVKSAPDPPLIKLPEAGPGQDALQSLTNYIEKKIGPSVKPVALQEIVDPHGKYFERLRKREQKRKAVEKLNRQLDEQEKKWTKMWKRQERMAKKMEKERQETYKYLMSLVPDDPKYRCDFPKDAHLWVPPPIPSTPAGTFQKTEICAPIVSPELAPSSSL